MIQFLTFLGGTVIAVFSMATYINERYYDKEDVDFKFRSVYQRLDSIKKIQCALIKDGNKILWEAECK